MDVDNSNIDGGPGNGGIDIEQSLLQQFSCMGTSDRDELIKNMQDFIGPNDLSYSAAAFFLDMNNWNLQSALCSYFDAQITERKLPSMAVLSDPVATEYESIEPNTKFKKTWRLFNNGNEQWPTGCTLQCASGNKLGASTLWDIPLLQPGEEASVTLEMESPSEPGTYHSKWRLCNSSGSYFGDPLWLIISVVEQGTIDLTQRLSHFSELGNNVCPTNSVALNPFDYHRSASSQQEEKPSDTDVSMS